MTKGPRTLEGFLRALKKSKREWYFQAGDCIRYRDYGPHTVCPCPLKAVFGQDRGTRLSWRTEMKVRHAADFSDRYPALRRRLLRACGLMEEK